MLRVFQKNAHHRKKGILHPHGRAQKARKTSLRFHLSLGGRRKLEQPGSGRSWQYGKTRGGNPESRVQTCSAAELLFLSSIQNPVEPFITLSKTIANLDNVLLSLPEHFIRMGNGVSRKITLESLFFSGPRIWENAFPDLIRFRECPALPRETGTETM